MPPSPEKSPLFGCRKPIPPHWYSQQTRGILFFRLWARATRIYPLDPRTRAPPTSFLHIFAPRILIAEEEPEKVHSSPIWPSPQFSGSFLPPPRPEKPLRPDHPNPRRPPRSASASPACQIPEPPDPQRWPSCGFKTSSSVVIPQSNSSAPRASSSRMSSPKSPPS